MKIQKSKSKDKKEGVYFLTLPVSIVRAKGWEKGDNIKVEINKEGDLVLKKK